MTVDALVLKKGSDEDVDGFPIAGQNSYDMAWFPATQELGLPMLSDIYSGISASGEEAQILIDEFSRLKEYLLHSPPDYISPEYIPQMLRSIDRAVKELNIVRDSPDLYIYIG